MRSPPPIRLSVRLFPLYLRNRSTIDLERARELVTTIACRGLKVKVLGQAKSVGPNSIEGSFF